MSLENNTIELQALLAAVNALPEAGSGEANPIVQPLSVTENGTYTAPEGVDGYNPVTVNVPSENLDDVAAEQYELIADIMTALEGKAAGGSITPIGTKQITANGNYDVTSYANAEVNVPIPDGYIKPAGAKQITANGTHDVTEYASVVVAVPEKAPVTEELTVTENGTYTPDSGVDGYSKVIVNVESSGGDGGAADIIDGLLTRDGPTEIVNDRITSIGINALNSCVNLVRASFPNVTTCDTSAFQNCGKLEQIDLPKVNTIGTNAFRSCASLRSFVCKNAVSMRAAFYGCSSLELVDVSTTRSVEANTFYGCEKLTTLILRNTTFYSLANVSAFTGTPIASGEGYIYLPRVLVDTHKTAANWSNYAAQYRALEDYTVDGTITGALDESKI